MTGATAALLVPGADLRPLRAAQVLFWRLPPQGAGHHLGRARATDQQRFADFIARWFNADVRHPSAAPPPAGKLSAHPRTSRHLSGFPGTSRKAGGQLQRALHPLGCRPACAGE